MEFDKKMRHQQGICLGMFLMFVLQCVLHMFRPEIFSSGSLCISPFRSGRNLACHELSSCWQSQVVQLYVQPLVAKEWYFTTSATAFHDPGNRVTCLATKKCAHHFKNWIPECYRWLKDCFLYPALVHYVETQLSQHLALRLYPIMKSSQDVSCHP